MAAISIALVGANLPCENLDIVELDKRQSLLEYDLVVFRPTVSAFAFEFNNQYQGRPIFTEEDSANIYDASRHWNKQINELLSIGRTVVVMLPEKRDYFRYTGEHQYNGTGKNARRTNIVGGISNYDLCRLDLQNCVIAEGSQIDAADANREIYSAWSGLSGESVYYCYFSDERFSPFLRIKNTNKCVGGVKRYEGGGCLIVMPDIPERWDSWWNDESDEYTDDGSDFAKRFSGFCDGIYKSTVTSDHEQEPDWCSAPDLVLPKELSLQLDITNNISRIRDIEAENEKLSNDLVDNIQLRSMLFRNGKPLERAIISALQECGIDADGYTDGSLEFDVVFELDGIRCIAEVEGKDNKSIDISKMSQLERCIQEDFARDTVEEHAKGILIGNPFRLKPPSERGEPFTKKAIAAANRTGVTLVTTVQLFKIFQEAREAGDPELARAKIKQIVEHPGGVFEP